MQIIQFENNKDKEHKEFFENLAEKTDQLVYIARDDEGNYSLGHTPLEVKDLIFMIYHLQEVIRTIVVSGEGV